MKRARGRKFEAPFFVFAKAEGGCGTLIG